MESDDPSNDSQAMFSVVMAAAVARQQATANQFAAATEEETYRAILAQQSNQSRAYAALLVPWWNQLRTIARDCIAKREFRLAVILAQTACDLQTEAALRLLLPKAGASPVTEFVLDSLPHSVSLHDKRVRRLWKDLTGEQPAGDGKTVPSASWWVASNAARDLRHDVVHKGANVDVHQATEALRAADIHSEYIAATVVRLTRGTP